MAKFEIPAEVQAELDARDAKQKKEAEKALKNGVLKIPNAWSNEQRGIPNLVLRSALFGVVRRGRREFLDGVKIASWGNTSIKFTGKRLQQSDQDIWMACIEACKREGKTNVTIGQRELLKLVGRKGGNTARLLDDLERLVVASIKIEDSQYLYMGSLLHAAIKDKNTGRIALTVDPMMASLFGTGSTHIEVTQRHALGADLSKWLHSYINSHASSYRKPHFIGLDKVQKLCGSAATKRKFRQQLRAALHELKNKKNIAGWSLENDVLKLWK